MQPLVGAVERRRKLCTGEQRMGGRGTGSGGGGKVSALPTLPPTWACGDDSTAVDAAPTTMPPPHPPPSVALSLSSSRDKRYSVANLARRYSTAPPAPCSERDSCASRPLAASSFSSFSCADMRRSERDREAARRTLEEGGGKLTAELPGGGGEGGAAEAQAIRAVVISWRGTRSGIEEGGGAYVHRGWKLTAHGKGLLSFHLTAPKQGLLKG